VKHFSWAYSNSTLKGWYRARIMPDMESRSNIAPTPDIVVISDGVMGRMGLLMRWSLIFYWSKM
jgi:putative SOS response-associated peptidase YedK